MWWYKAGLKVPNQPSSPPVPRDERPEANVSGYLHFGRHTNLWRPNSGSTGHGGHLKLLSLKPQEVEEDQPSLSQQL